MGNLYIFDKEGFAEVAIRASQLYNAGVSINEISERMNVSETTIKLIISDCKIETLL